MGDKKKGRTVGIGIQDFEEIEKGDYFYIDKTSFIKEWWESGDSVTLITRPRRFGKTLNMSMSNRFFSNEYAGQGEIFEKLSIWNEKTYRELQGTYPVINLSFANVKETDYDATSKRIVELLMAQFEKYNFITENDKLSENEKNYMKKMAKEMTIFDAGSICEWILGPVSKLYQKSV